MNKLRCCLPKDNQVQAEKEHENYEDGETLQTGDGRRCRDTIFLIVYPILIGLLAFLASFSFQNCYISHFWQGTDSWGNVCGGDSRTVRKIEGVEGSGVIKSESIYVWITTISSSCTGSAPIRLCVKECPNQSVTNVTSKMCSKILAENDYRTTARTVTMKQCELIEDCLNTKQWTTNGQSAKVIMNRCLSSSVLTDGYVAVKDYVIVMNYVMDDVIKNLAPIVVISSFVLVSTILGCMVYVRFPKYASITCYVSGFSMSALTFIYMLTITALKMYYDPITLSENYIQSTQRIVTSYSMAYFLVAVMSFISSVNIAVNYYRVKSHGQQGKGLWIGASLCISDSPKILSQPMLSMFATAITTLFFTFLSLSVSSCQNLLPSADKLVVQFEQDALSWVVVPSSLTYVWIVALIGRGQKALIAGAVTEWYFRRPKHPLTISLKSLVRYNLGSLVASMFSSLNKEKILSYFYGNEEKPKLVAYISPTAPISVGVYGEIKFTSLSSKDKKNRTEQVVQEAYRQTRDALGAWVAGVSYVSVSLKLLATSENQMFIPLMPLLLTMILSWYICGIFADSLDATLASLAICIGDDWETNNGRDKPYFCSRKVVHYLFGVILAPTATHKGLERLRKQEIRSKDIRARASLVFRRYSDAKTIMQLRKRRELFKKREEEDRKLKKTLSFSDRETRKRQLLRVLESIENSENKSSRTGEVNDDAKSESRDIEAVEKSEKSFAEHEKRTTESISTKKLIETEKLVPVNQPSEREHLVMKKNSSPPSSVKEKRFLLNINSAEESKIHPNSIKEKGILPNVNRTEETKIPPSSSNTNEKRLATFSDTREATRFEKMVMTGGAKTMAPKWLEEKKKIKIIKTVRKQSEDEDDDDFNWW